MKRKYGQIGHTLLLVLYVMLLYIIFKSRFFRILIWIIICKIGFLDEIRKLFPPKLMNRHVLFLICHFWFLILPANEVVITQEIRMISIYSSVVQSLV